MSKKYKNKICVYCRSEKSASADHVFAREFFLEGERGNIPKVPSCLKCNNEKSKLETSLLATLPFAGRHKDAKKHLTSRVPARLEKNKTLGRKLSHGFSYSWVLNPQGSFNRVGTLDFDLNDVLAYIKFVVPGLTAYHFDVLLNKEHSVFATFVDRNYENLFEPIFKSSEPDKHISQILGQKTISYEGVQVNENLKIPLFNESPITSLWRFKIFEIQFCENLDSSKKVAETIYASTALPGL